MEREEVYRNLQSWQRPCLSMSAKRFKLAASRAPRQPCQAPAGKRRCRGRLARRAPLARRAGTLPMGGAPPRRARAARAARAPHRRFAVCWRRPPSRWEEGRLAPVVGALARVAVRARVGIGYCASADSEARDLGCRLGAGSASDRICHPGRNTNSNKNPLGGSWHEKSISI